MTLGLVQAEIRPEAYLSEEAFRDRVYALLRALGEAPPPRLVAFPEYFGLPLLLFLEAPFNLRAQSLKEALFNLLRREGPLFPWGRAGRALGVYRRVFAGAAQDFGAYILAGSLLTPWPEEETSRGSFFQGLGFYNLAFLFTPKGRILARIPKMRLTPLEGLLRRGRFGPHFVRTEALALGVLICLDAFFEGHLERLDALGARALLVPSANPRAWAGPWSGNPGRVEGEVWVEALRGKIQDRENLKLLLNPMLNGDLLGLSFEGRSGFYAPGKTLLAPVPKGDWAAWWPGDI